MKKNIVRLASVLLASALISPQFASASAYTRIVPVDLDDPGKRFEFVEALADGQLIMLTDVIPMQSIVVVTDGTKPDETALQAIPTFTSCEEYDVDNEFVSYMSIPLAEGQQAYEVKLSSFDNIVNIARKLDLENECIEDVYLVRRLISSDCGVFPNGLEITTKDADALLAGAIPELTLVEVDPHQNGQTVLRAGFVGDLRTEGDAIDDDDNAAKYRYVMSVGAQLQEKYGTDLLTTYTPVPSWSLAEGSLSNAATSVWDQFGDSDGNGTIDAVDASKVLQYTAAAGNGQAYDGISLAASDVNMDGRVDALDASLMLQFSSQYGVDDTTTILDVIR